jgi:hypothetical protein
VRNEEEEKKNAYKVLEGGSQNEEDHYEDLGVDGWIIIDFREIEWGSG